MARNPSGSSRSGTSPKSDKQGSSGKVESVPVENVEILKDGFGFDITKKKPAEVQAFVQVLSRSMSSSPYTSAAMLEDYVKRGFPDLPGRVLEAIDIQRDHRIALEQATTSGSERRRNRSQIFAQVLGCGSVIGALIGGYYQVPTTICIAVVVVGVGGPNAATILGRVMDKWAK